MLYDHRNSLEERCDIRPAKSRHAIAREKHLQDRTERLLLESEERGRQDLRRARSYFQQAAASILRNMATLLGTLPLRSLRNGNRS